MRSESAVRIAGVRERARGPRGGTTAPEVNTDRVLASLADPTRRQLLEALGRRPACSATALTSEVPVSRQAVVKHLGVLRDSQLVVSRRVGKEVLFSVRPEALVATASWMTELASTWQERLQQLKHAAEH